MIVRRILTGRLVTGRLVTGPLVALAVFTAAAFLTTPADAAAQVRPSSEADALGIDGPPPPIAPEVVSRDATGNATVRAVRLTEPIDIDGNLDESFYTTLPSITDFVQSLPIAGGVPTERTEVWITYDGANIYVSARAWDSAPESEWVANEMRRDTNQLRQNDTFGVVFDTYYDRRNGLGFYTNPLGALAEFQLTNEGSPNSDWNPIWDVRTGRFDGGWTVEMEIPFKSLRYRPGRQQVWGLQLRRAIRRKNEWNYLTALPQSVVGTGSSGVFRVSMAGTLMGLEAPPASRNLEVKPYGIAGLQSQRTDAGAIDNEWNSDAGLDVKYGITENLTADFTFNTDFAQVEVDEQQVNLTRFSLFFPEKREFFLEGRGIFGFAPGVSSGGGPGGPGGGSTPTLFYSRRIGLQDGEPVPILGGARVTGKLGSFDVGALNIQTDDLGPAIESTNFSVLRLRRDIFSRSSIGVLFENRSRSAIAEGSNQAYGVDASFAFGENVSFVTYYSKTRTRGLNGNDESYRASFGYGGDTWGGQAQHLLVGDDFNPEIGFVRRKGFRQSSVSGRFSPRPASIDWIRQLTFSANIGYLEKVDERILPWENAGPLESREGRVRFQAEFENSDNFSVTFNDSYENLLQDERISGATIPAGKYGFQDVQVSYNFGPQRPYSGQLSVLRGDYFTGDRTSIGFSRARIEILPQLSLEPSLQFNWIHLPDQEAFDGEFNQHVARVRVNYSVSPRMYVSGLVQYNSGSDSFSSNFRLRWEWAPGSELFVVYTEDRDTDVFDRWSELSNRGFVVKVNRLLRI
jgi:hypothetical protein